MNVKTYGRLFRIAVALLAVISCAAVGVAQNQENIGKVQQGLVAPGVVSVEDQEKYSLVTLSTGCSGSLLRNNWVITAAHCVEIEDPRDRKKVIAVPDGSVTVTADWRNDQERQSIRIITFRPNDVAIIRVDKAFTVGGSDTKFIRDIFRDGQFPYFGQLAPIPIKAFGRGINQFAFVSDTGATMPSFGDGNFRIGFFRTNREEDNLYWYPSASGQHIAGGDSGGPSFATVRGTDEVLMGVHSLCKTKCMAGMTCGKWPGPLPPPLDYSKWKWVTDTTECADAPIAPVWEDINRYLGAYIPSPLLGKPSAPAKPRVTAMKTPFRILVEWEPAPGEGTTVGWYSVEQLEGQRWHPLQGRHNVGSEYERSLEFSESTSDKRKAFRVCAENPSHKTCSLESWYYPFAAPQDRVEAEVNAERSVPVIKGTGSTTLEGGAATRASSINPPVSATQQEALAAKGEAIAHQDPLSIELRNRQPEGSARRGFDIGMAAAEGQTQDGPNKKRMHDSLPAAEQPGFRTAVAFSLERNKNAAFASKGAVIAAQDPMVADARMAEGDVFYWLGFDIATGIFGDPALGAQGNTQTGPNSLGIRDGLSAAGQRGFNAAVKLHLSRNYKP